MDTGTWASIKSDFTWKILQYISLQCSEVSRVKYIEEVSVFNPSIYVNLKTDAMKYENIISKLTHISYMLVANDCCQFL